MRKLNRSEQKPTLIAQKKDMFNLSNDEYYNPKLSELPFRKDTVQGHCSVLFVYIWLRDRVAATIRPVPS